MAKQLQLPLMKIENLGMVRDIRREEARKILEQSSMAVKEIAWEVGYEHNTNFTNAFSATLGTSQAAYAKHFAKYKKACGGG